MSPEDADSIALVEAAKVTRAGRRPWSKECPVLLRKTWQALTGPSGWFRLWYPPQWTVRDGDVSQTLHPPGSGAFFAISGAWSTSDDPADRSLFGDSGGTVSECPQRANGPMNRNCRLPWKAGRENRRSICPPSGG